MIELFWFFGFLFGLSHSYIVYKGGGNLIFRIDLRSSLRNFTTTFNKYYLLVDGLTFDSMRCGLGVVMMFGRFCDVEIVSSMNYFYMQHKYDKLDRFLPKLTIGDNTVYVGDSLCCRCGHKIQPQDAGLNYFFCRGRFGVARVVISSWNLPFSVGFIWDISTGLFCGS